MLASSVCSALILPGAFVTSCHCLVHGLHHPHLCVHHPAYAASMVFPAAVVLAGWAYFALPKLSSLLARCWHTWLWVRRFTSSPVHRLENVAFRLIDAPGLGACTTGIIRPIIAIDRQLWSRLNEEERRAVLHHEDAHCRRLDPLSSLLLEACAALAVPTHAVELLRRWRAAAEAECDRHAAARVGSPESVASALLSLESYHRSQPACSVPLSVGAGGSALEARVRTLLDADRGAQPANLVSDTLAVALGGLAVVVAVTLVGGDVVHHAGETVLGLFVSHRH
ncbi:MAG TPA: M56 family metallopeptidase [Polyangiaceae bacterium]|nr:M56 family metallopeptidase [Polyangiaceae bacterium]